MSKIFVDMGLSLDGYIAGNNRGPANPLGDGGVHIHDWMFKQQTFKQSLSMDDHGETGADDDLVKEALIGIGACIMGKRMFEEGEANWPEEAPFRCPVFVLTHEQRAPWERKGGTTFYFVNTGLADALHQARKAANGKPIRISGGADVVKQSLEAGIVDEMLLHIAPMLLGDGLRLFDGLSKSNLNFEIAETIHSPLVTHIRYKIKPD